MLPFAVANGLTTYPGRLFGGEILELARLDASRLGEFESIPAEKSAPE